MATSKSKTSVEKKAATSKTTAKTSSIKTATRKAVANKPETKVVAKATAKTPVTKKPVATKKPATAPKTAAAKKPAATRTRKAAAASAIPSPEQRYRMIEVAAYFLAEKNSFAGSSLDYWVAAEAQIDGMLGNK